MQYEVVCIIVEQVIPGSPGDRAGFRANDVVVSFDGKPVESINEVKSFRFVKFCVSVTN